MSDSEDDQRTPVPELKQPANASKAVRLKNRTVLSDEDEDDMRKPTRKLRSTRASKTVDSDDERDAKALMDIDDGNKACTHILQALC